MTTITTDRLVPITEVCKTLGIPQDNGRALRASGVRVVEDWAGRLCVTEADAARLLDEYRTASVANRERKQREAEQRARDDQTFENDQERRYFTAFAAVVEHGGPYGDREAPGVAFNVINADDPENALKRVIAQFGEPDVRSIMYVMNKRRRPSWAR